MITFKTKIRVRYAETDQMGYVYYGNYATYFEVARVETLRSLGVSYKELEENGIMLPVRELKIQYKKPAVYDDELTIKVIIKEIPKTRFVFLYETYNSQGTLLNLAETTLVFVNKSTKYPMSAPAEFMAKLAPFF